jgi:hypothetical protein
VTDIMNGGKVAWKFYWFSLGKVERYQAKCDVEEQSSTGELEGAGVSQR